MPEIKTFEDACAALNLDPNALPVVDALPEKHRKALQAHYKLIIIAEALNEGWQPDWTDWDQYKYFPWFEFRRSAGFGFSFGACPGLAHAHSDVGSRLCFKTRDLAKYAGKQFEDLYRDYLVIE
jgi:hypothetical protein